MLRRGRSGCASALTPVDVRLARLAGLERTSRLGGADRLLQALDVAGDGDLLERIGERRAHRRAAGVGADAVDGGLRRRSRAARRGRGSSRTSRRCGRSACCRRARSGPQLLEPRSSWTRHVVELLAELRELVVARRSAPDGRSRRRASCARRRAGARSGACSDRDTSTAKAASARKPTISRPRAADFARRCSSAAAPGRGSRSSRARREAGPVKRSRGSACRRSSQRLARRDVRLLRAGQRVGEDVAALAHDHDLEAGRRFTRAAYCAA